MSIKKETIEFLQTNNYLDIINLINLRNLHNQLDNNLNNNIINNISKIKI
jgi:hypothetical protein